MVIKYSKWTNQKAKVNVGNNWATIPYVYIYSRHWKCESDFMVIAQRWYTYTFVDTTDIYIQFHRLQRLAIQLQNTKICSLQNPKSKIHCETTKYLYWIHPHKSIYHKYISMFNFFSNLQEISFWWWNCKYIHSFHDPIQINL